MREGFRSIQIGSIPSIIYDFGISASAATVSLFYFVKINTNKTTDSSFWYLHHPNISDYATVGIFLIPVTILDHHE